MTDIAPEEIPSDNKQLRVYDQQGTHTRVSVDEAIARGYNRWRDWHCSAGKRGLYIDYDGNIWIANCASTVVDRFNRTEWKRVIKQFHFDNGDSSPQLWAEREQQLIKDFSMSGVAFKRPISREEGKDHWGYLGNIYEGFDCPDSYAICKFDNCGCGADVILSKHKLPQHRTLLDVTDHGVQGTVRTQGYRDSLRGEPVAVEMNFDIPYQVLWDVSRRCNYDCAYCWPGVHNNREEFPAYETVIAAIDSIIDTWSRGAQIRWNFGGGEPTMHPRFLDILRHLKSRGQWVLVTTNGSRSSSFWSEAVKYINSINMSAHFSSMDQYPGNEDRFVENCRIIMDHHDRHSDDHWLEIKLMTPPGQLTKAAQFAERIRSMDRLHRLGANNRMKGVLSLVPIRDWQGKDNNLVRYTEDELRYFQNQ